MNHRLLACRLGTRAPAPCCALSPKPYTMCTPKRMRICTRTLTLSNTSQLRLSPLATVQFSQTVPTSYVNALASLYYSWLYPYVSIYICHYAQRLVLDIHMRKNAAVHVWY